MLPTLGRTCFAVGPLWVRGCFAMQADLHRTYSEPNQQWGMRESLFASRQNGTGGYVRTYSVLSLNALSWGRHNCYSCYTSFFIHFASLIPSGSSLCISQESNYSNCSNCNRMLSPLSFADPKTPSVFHHNSNLSLPPLRIVLSSSSPLLELFLTQWVKNILSSS